MVATMALKGQNETTRAEPVESVSDAELMEQVQQQDKHALELLHERYFNRAVGVSFKVLRDEDLAQEVAQEAFWRVWQRAQQFQGRRGSFTNWLFGIVRNLSIDEIRRDRSAELPDDDDLSDAPSYLITQDNLTDVVDERIRYDSLRAAMQKLPPAQRQVLELAYFHGLTRREISSKLGEPLGTVHTRALLGMNKLREMVSPE
ncbi:MAG: sigma-70 family RNA polymerase sigma factor [Chloroflexi bacterium]|nr:sigma-70 family RNA polymerase sigma factor [Chloroflexota bacterium]